MVTRDQAVVAAKLHQHIRHSGIGCPAINCCTMAAYILQPDPLIEAVGRLSDRYNTFGITDTPDAHKLFREVARLLGERRGN